MQSFADPIERAERCFGDREGVVAGEVRLSFGAFAERCRRLAGWLLARTQRGDRVAVLAANSHQQLELYCAVPACGRLIVPLNGRHALPEIAYALRDSGARLLFTDWSAAALGELADLASEIVPLGAGYEDRIAGAPRAALGRGVGEDDLAGLFYTGGTTGASKGVMLSQRNKLADALHLNTSVRLTQDDTWQVISPMFHTAGTFHALLCLWVGARQVILPGFEARGVLDAIERERSSVMFGVPTMLSAMLEEQRARERDLSSLRLLGYGAAPASSSLLRRVRDALPRCELVSMYGATELAPMATTLEHMERCVDDERALSAGRPIPGVRLRILDAEGRELGPREVGEVAVAGPNVMRGYWNKAEQTAEVLRLGWYHTGDLGFLDERGCLYLVDRAKDMIVSGGENVYSSEVEEVLYRHPAVLECAVFGVPDPHWGEAVRAAVVLRPGRSASEDELREHCRRALGGYKVPKAVDLHGDALPKSGAGKILKRALRAPFWQGRERGIHGSE